MYLFYTIKEGENRFGVFSTFLLQNSLWRIARRHFMEEMVAQ